MTFPLFVRASVYTYGFIYFFTNKQLNFKFVTFLSTFNSKINTKSNKLLRVQYTDKNKNTFQQSKLKTIQFGFLQKLTISAHVDITTQNTNRNFVKLIINKKVFTSFPTINSYKTFTVI